MAAPFSASIPPDLDLDANYIVRFAALSPTDGSAVSGVVVSGVSILAQALVAGASEPSGAGSLADFVPAWLDLPNTASSEPAAPPGAAG